MKFKIVEKVLRFMRTNKAFMAKHKVFVCLPDAEFDKFETEWYKYLKSRRTVQDIYSIPALFAHPICGFYVNGHRIVSLSSYQEYMDA